MDQYPFVGCVVDDGPVGTNDPRSQPGRQQTADLDHRPSGCGDDHDPGVESGINGRQGSLGDRLVAAQQRPIEVGENHANGHPPIL